MVSEYAMGAAAGPSVHSWLNPLTQAAEDVRVAMGRQLRPLRVASDCSGMNPSSLCLTYMEIVNCTRPLVCLRSFQLVLVNNEYQFACACSMQSCYQIPATPKISSTICVKSSGQC